VKYVFKNNTSENLFRVSQGTLNPSNLFKVICVTQIEFSHGAVEDIYDIHR